MPRQGGGEIEMKGPQLMERKLFIGGQWVMGGSLIKVHNKYTGEVIGKISAARREDIEAAIGAAHVAAPTMGAARAQTRQNPCEHLRANSRAQGRVCSFHRR